MAGIVALLESGSVSRINEIRVRIRELFDRRKILRPLRQAQRHLRTSEECQSPGPMTSVGQSAFLRFHDEFLVPGR